MTGNLMFLFPIFLGVVGFLQSAMNQAPGEQHGWLLTGFVNNSVGLVFAFGLLAFAAWSGRGVTAQWSDWRWWYLIPGCFGMIFVVGMPYSIQIMGASRTFVFLIATQMVSSLVWDAAKSGVVPPVMRIAGAALAVAGAALSLF